MEGNSPSQMGKTRVMFLAWGYSIHAKRRIQLFVDDPLFDVTVVSTHNYDFKGARNIRLGTAQGSNPACGMVPDTKEPDTGGDSIPSYGATTKALKLLVRKNRLLFLLAHLFRDIRTAIRDVGILRTAFRTCHPDTIFLQTLLYPSYLSYFLPRCCPVIITFWNGDVTWWAKFNGIERLLKRQIVTYGVRRARAITVNSETASNACLGYGAEKGKIHIIRYPGADLERFRPAGKDEARKRLGIDFGKVVFCPRGLGGYLNSDIIVEASAEIIRKYPDTLFLFVSGVAGEGDLERHRARTRELGVEGHFRWEGHVSWEEMPSYYNAADVFISISSHDSLPNCMIEAMACGVPVIMGDIPQIREWITDGENGFLVPPRDHRALAGKMTELFSNENRIRDSFIARSLALVKERADGRRNAEIIKQLVHNTAWASAYRENMKARNC